jgi:hypothetical protein
MTDDQRLSERTDERVADGPLMDLHDQLVEAIARQQSTVTPLPPSVAEPAPTRGDRSWRAAVSL